MTHHEIGQWFCFWIMVIRFLALGRLFPSPLILLLFLQRIIILLFFFAAEERGRKVERRQRRGERCEVLAKSMAARA